MKSTYHSTAPDLAYRLVRAHLALNGLSLAGWCKARGISRQWAVLVLRGERNGPAAKKLRDQILSDLGIADVA